MSPSRRRMIPVSASQTRAADSTSVSSTACRSKVEQLCVLDGDDGLGSEIADKLDLLVGKRAHFLTVDGNDADKLVVLEHRHANQAPGTCNLDAGDYDRIAPPIGLRLRQIVHLDRLLSLDHPGNRRAGAGTYFDLVL